MINPFDVPHMAAGYESARPPVHPHVIERVARRLDLAGPVARALDVGCGAGRSTAPLARLARQCIGVEPSELMLRRARQHAPAAMYAVGSAEALPIRSSSIDLITAAGSLNWVDLDRFFPEGRRTMTPGSALVIYDFARRRDPRSPTPLERWDDEFSQRYPVPEPPTTVDPANLDTEPHGLLVTAREDFEVELELSEDFYLRYALTETNAAEAIRTGTSATEIRDWCAATLREVFRGGPREVAFAGYIVYLRANQNARRVERSGGARP